MPANYYLKEKLRLLFIVGSYLTLILFIYNHKKLNIKDIDYLQFQYFQDVEDGSFLILTIKLLGELIMKKVSKETKREQRYNANLHNIFVKAQKEINANEQYGRNLCASNKKNTGTLFRT